MFRVALVLTLLSLAPGALAQSEPHKAVQMVGVSTQSLLGDAGVFGMTLACQQTFPESRMCTSEEILSTFQVPSLLSEAWVRPTAFGASGDVSGINFSVRDLSCDGWDDDGSGSHGLTVSPHGAFNNTLCNTARPAACCALIPVPEPSSTLLTTTGAAGFAGLAMLKKKPRGDFLTATAGVGAVLGGLLWARSRRDAE